MEVGDDFSSVIKEFQEELDKMKMEGAPAILINILEKEVDTLKEQSKTLLGGKSENNSGTPEAEEGHKS